MLSTGHNGSAFNGRPGTEPRSNHEDYTAAPVRCIGGLCRAPCGPSLEVLHINEEVLLPFVDGSVKSVRLNSGTFEAEERFAVGVPGGQLHQEIPTPVVIVGRQAHREHRFSSESVQASHQRETFLL
jgi:hypothetical protein